MSMTYRLRALQARAETLQRKAAQLTDDLSEIEPEEWEFGGFMRPSDWIDNAVDGAANAADKIKAWADEVSDNRGKRNKI